MDLSVIIPVYNAESTLARCVGSVLKALEGIDAEIIIVNDGSTDRSERIATGIAINSPQIKYIEKANGGVSSARNLGLSKAQGRWLTFVDADDTITSDCFQRLFTFRSNISNAEIVILQSFIGETERYPWQKDFTPDSIYSREDLMKKGYLRGSICGCVFKRGFLADNTLYFPEGIRLGEDTLFFCACLIKADRICFANIPFYQISPRPDSASRQKRPQDISDIAKAISWTHNNLPSCAIRNYTLFKLMIEITSRAVNSGIPAGSVVKMTEGVLPLPLKGIPTDRWKMVFLNLNYPFFFRLISLRNRLSTK